MYRVIYIDEFGQKKQDLLALDSIQEVYNYYAKKNKVVLKVSKHRTFSFLKKKQSELAYILQALSDLLKSGFSLTSSINIVANSLDDKSVYKEVFIGMYNMLTLGKSFVDALQQYNIYFGETAVQMIKSGYETGNLAKTLDIAAYYVLELDQIKKEVYKKLAYPVIVFILSLFLLIVNTTVIVPRILQSEMFKVVAASATTKVTVAMLKTLSIMIPSVIFMLVVTVFLLSIWFRMNQRKVEMFLLKIPFLRELIFHRAFFISFFSISKLLLVGVKLSDALKIMERVNTIKVIREEFYNARQCLKRGESLVNGFKHLTKLEKQMLSLSLNVERLANNFEIVAKRFYNKHIDTIKKINPILYFVSLSLVVAVFMLTFLSVFLPYLRVLTDIGGMR